LHSYAFMKYIDSVIFSLSLLKLQLAVMLMNFLTFFSSAAIICGV
jgi:hypothetical protein